MASLIVRHLDDDIVARLKEKALRNGRSAEAEHRAILKAALDDDQDETQRKAAWLAKADAFRKSLEGRHHTPSEVLLRESRDER